MTKHKVIGKSGYEYVSSYDEIVQHTIEQCIQIIKEKWWIEANYELQDEIIAAMRELRDRS